MRHLPTTAFVVTALSVAIGSLVACGGSTSDGTDSPQNGTADTTRGATDPTTGSPPPPSTSPGATTTRTTTTIPPGAGQDACCSDTAPVCIDIEATDFDQSCNQDSDCTAVYSGTMCNGAAEMCSCPNSAINSASLTAYQAQASLPGAPTVFCGCPAILGPRCVANKCTAGDVDLVDGG